MVMRMLLNLKNIYKNYGKEPLIVPVLKDVSLEVVKATMLRLWDQAAQVKQHL